MYEKFRHLMEEKGVSAYRVSKESGVKTQTLSAWKNGNYTPKPSTIQKLADYFQVPLSYFYESDLSDRVLVDYPEEYFEQKEPVHDVAAGQGRIASQPESYSEEGQLARVIGDSMYPSLHDGDVVRFVEAVDVEPSDFALVRINGDELTVKHVRWTMDGLWVMAENKDVFPDRFYSVKEISTIPIQVVGKAVEVRRKL